jgi:hypothetical protein
MSECSGVVMTTLCTIDPRRAAACVEREGAAAPQAGRWQDYSSWSVFAWTIGTPRDQRTRIFLRDYLDDRYWLPGGPDNPFHGRF